MAKRLVYFRGHPQQPDSVLVVQVYKDYETCSQVLWTGEWMARTLWNLYNLHAVRGALTTNQQLVGAASMSGPHHYFGWWDPTVPFAITFDNGVPVYRPATTVLPAAVLSPVPFLCHLTQYTWLSGQHLPAALRPHVNPKEVVNTATGATTDSLFAYPGLLLMNATVLYMPLLPQPHLYDLSRFRARVVPNTGAIAFHPQLVAEYAHAQHKLRIVTYYYGPRYVPDYILSGSGLFLERHEFIQAITPMDVHCGGYVLLGHCAESTLDLVAVPVPFGYTLVVDVGCIHGDSTLTGLYAMAMTGNHEAMATANTVFLKTAGTFANVRLEVTKEEVATEVTKVEVATEVIIKPTREPTREPTTEPITEPAAAPLCRNLLITSDTLSLAALKHKDAELQQDILARLDPVTRLWWQPVVVPFPGWKKTLAHLPNGGIKG